MIDGGSKYYRAHNISVQSVYDLSSTMTDTPIEGHRIETNIAFAEGLWVQSRRNSRDEPERLDPQSDTVTDSMLLSPSFSMTARPSDTEKTLVHAEPKPMTDNRVRPEASGRLGAFVGHPNQQMPESVHPIPVLGLHQAGTQAGDGRLVEMDFRPFFCQQFGRILKDRQM
jgi:hypothetical protein